MANNNTGEGSRMIQLPRQFNSVTFSREGREALEKILTEQKGNVVLLSSGAEDGVYELATVGENYNAAALFDERKIEFSLDSLAGILIPQDKTGIKTAYPGRFRKFAFPNHLSPERVISSLVGETVIIDNNLGPIDGYARYDSGFVQSAGVDTYEFKTLDAQAREQTPIPSYKYIQVKGILVPERLVLPEFLKKPMYLDH